MNSLDMQVVHINSHITTTKYIIFKMINLIHMISIFYHCVLYDGMYKTRSHLHIF
jgi:hypothetical protein